MKNVMQMLENTAARIPTKTAVIDQDAQCTYQELLSRAQAIGTFLAQRIAPRQPVVCFMDKSISCLQAFFGIVCARGFYTLLDPGFPQERIQQILNVLQPALILTTHHWDQQSEKLGQQNIVYLEDIQILPDTDLLAQRRREAVDTDPLYCNFTSGSTGVPKGVLVSHRSVIDFIGVFTKEFGITEQDVIGNQAPFDFDVSVKDIYSAMLTGATLVIIPREYFMFPTKIMDMLDQYHVTTLIWAVSALCMLIRLHGFKYKIPRAIRRILFSGEVMPIRQLNQLRQYYPNAQFVNLYGPTEITCNCTYYVLDREFSEGEKLPIGIPFDNETVFLLDENDAPAGNGPGEICVAGTALALGYYNNPEMTARNFVRNPLNSLYPETIYRTGDLGYFENGLLYFSGRKDFQIKHMGHRIELEEIETSLGALDGISHVCCAYDEEKNKILAFYAGSAEKAELIKALKRHLPDYMIPNVFRKVDAIPLTKNGKTDRKSLFSMYKNGNL